MAYEALDEWLDPALALTAKGHTWTFPVPTAERVLGLKRLFLDATTITMEVEEREAEGLAGPTLWSDLWQVPEITRWHILRTALIHYGLGEQVGHQFWVGGPIAGKVLRALEDAETTPAPPGTTGPTTPAAGGTTKRRASATGTTRAPRKPKGSASPGRPSSTAGSA